MVDAQIAARGVVDGRVLVAMRRVPRHRFVPDALQAYAYADRPLPIGYRQTISQPFIVAFMTEQLRLERGDRVFEVGTGSGYQAAILAEMGAEVWSVEIVPELAERSTLLLADLGYENVRVRAGDGYAGWPEEAPFDAIILTAAPPELPLPLLEQLAPGGRLIAPVGSDRQWLRLVRRKADGSLREEDLIPVRFVPMTGRAQEGG